MGWGQDLHSSFLAEGKMAKRMSMNEVMQTDWEGVGGVRCAVSQPQIQLMPLRGVDQVMTWGLLD